ncbi:MAG: methylglyoxal synthase [Bacteroidales bacterium]
MKNIAVIAHDAKKPELALFLKDHEEWLPGVNLLATGRTAEFIEEQGVKCRHLSPGQSGGYNEITEMIQRHEVDLVIFLRDHKVIQAHHEDIRKLLEACNVNNIPLATNQATAELVILGQIRKEAIDRMKRNS